MKENHLNGILAGQAPLSQFWGKLELPVVQCAARRPVFHESGYASGHANADLAVPGLMDWLSAHTPDATGHFHFAQGEQYKTGWGWTWVQFADERSLVFLAHVYDGRHDVFHMSN